ADDPGTDLAGLARIQRFFENAGRAADTVAAHLPDQLAGPPRPPGAGAGADRYWDRPAAGGH
ncbi:MAG: hypothetical protein ACK5RL_06320, partial [Acidimicrobiales bacterium]